MKKWQIGLLTASVAVLGCMALFGCSSGGSDSSSGTEEAAVEETAAADSKPAAESDAPKEEAVQEQSAEEELVDEAVEEVVDEAVDEVVEDVTNTSEYEVTIDGYEIRQDYEGNPCIVVTYSWMNNSDEAVSAIAAVHEKAFQNGVQLDTTIVTDSDVDSTASLNEVKPGYGNTYQYAYKLTDESDVTIEVEELVSFDDTLLAEATFSIA